MPHKKKYQVGIDLGGTKIEGIVLNQEGKEIKRKRIATEQIKGYHHLLNQIVSLYNELIQDFSSQETSFGICTPGSISLETGNLRNSNTLCLNDKPFKQDLEGLLEKEIVIENDANCFALAEAMNGSGVNQKMVFGVILGTGCGGGIVHEGKLYRGKEGIAGEWGHMTLEPKGPKCYCGKRGCVEVYLSGNGASKLFESQYKKALNFPQIIENFRNKDADCLEFMEIYLDYFARALVNVINLLDPDLIVIGGGVSKVKELYTLGAEHVKKYVFSDSYKISIVPNQLGDSAGVFGAAYIGI